LSTNTDVVYKYLYNKYKSKIKATDNDYTFNTGKYTYLLSNSHYTITITKNKPIANSIKLNTKLYWVIKSPDFNGALNYNVKELGANQTTLIYSLSSVDASNVFKTEKKEIGQGEIILSKKLLQEANKHTADFMPNSKYTKYEAENGIIGLISKNSATALIAKKSVELKFFESDKANYKLIKINTSYNLPGSSGTSKNYKEYICEGVKGDTFSFINDFTFPIITSYKAKDGTYLEFTGIED
jgi:hypothetical protein